jgi:hypothetical protein
MKYTRFLSLAAISVVAVMALGATASATTLTSPSGTTYTGAIKLENGSRISITSELWGFGSYECTGWRHEFKVETHGAAVTAGGKVTNTEIFPCSQPGITIVSPGAFEIHSTGTTGSGTLTWTGLKFILDETLVGKCVFEPAVIDLGTLEGSNITKGKAKVTFSTAIPISQVNPFCGTNATLEGSFVVTTPSTLEVH